MVLAGPGSGKTTVIAGRVSALIKKKLAAPQEILVLTFTRQAAREMEARFLKQPDGMPGVRFATIHAFFYRALNEAGGKEKQTLLSERARARLIREVLWQAAPDKAREPEIEERMAQVFSVMKAGNIPDPAYVPLYNLYEKKKQERGLLDFDDILLKALRLLKEDKNARRTLREKYRFILVDEFQDVSPLQYELIKLLAIPKNNLFVVGDDDQSIYAFRGADASVMQHFSRDFPDARVLLLSRNYRSGSAIVEASLRLIGHNRFRFQKALTSSAGTIGQVQFISCTDSADERQKIIAVLKQWGDDTATREPPPGRGNTGSGTAAILTRTNEEAAQLQRALTENGISCTLSGPQKSFWSDPFFSPYFAYLSLASGQNNQKLLLRVLNFPPRAIPREDLLFSGDLPSLKHRYKTKGQTQLYQAVCALEKDLDTLSRLKDPYTMLRYIRGPLRTDAYLRESQPPAAAKERLEKLERLMESARSYRSVPQWFRYIAAEAAKEEQNMEGQAADSGPAGPPAPTAAAEGPLPVRILTMHAAKGLEFDLVLIPGLVEGNIPRPYTGGRQNSPHTSLSPEEAAIEEERRLFYVGMTRARKILLLFCPQERHGKEQKPSRFLDEIKK